MQLWKINEELKILRREYQEEELPELLEEIQKLEVDFNEKVQACIAVIKEKKSEKEVIKTAINELKDKINTLDNSVEWLSNYLKEILKAEGITNFKSPLHNVRIGHSKSVEIIDEDVIPEEYITLIKKISKSDILRRFREGRGAVQGAQILEKEYIVTS